MIKVNKVSKSYCKEKIIENISLSIKEGNVFGFLGPNGAGKTTSIKMLVGLSKPTCGEILIDGKNPFKPKNRETIGFMPEDPYFYDHLTGLELMQFCGQLFNKYRKKNNGYHLNILKKVGLFDAKNKMIRHYSKGMKQRLGLATAMVNDPQYIFLDEPLDGLDPIGRRKIKKIIRELKKEGKTIFFNSHILADVEEIADQIGIINKGKLIYSGTVKKFCGKKKLEDKFVEIIEKDE